MIQRKGAGDFGFWILDFGFWILDYEESGDNPKSKIKNPKSPAPLP